MPLINYEALNFPNQRMIHLQGRNQLNCSWSEILKAAITYGFLNINQRHLHGLQSIKDIFSRIFRLESHLELSQSNRLLRTAHYRHLDSTEMAFVSYFLGMTLNKILMNRLFGVPWLVHLNTLRSMGYRFDFRGLARPDFIGFHPHYGYLISEAKGYSGGIRVESLHKGKGQVRSVRQVNNCYPFMRVVTATGFSPNLYAKVMDPPKFVKNAIDIHVSSDHFVEAYYAPFKNLNTDVLKFGPVRIEIKLDQYESKKNLRKAMEEANFLEFNDGEIELFDDGIEVYVDEEDMNNYMTSQNKK